MSLKTDYKDAILKSGTTRKYKMVDNGDGTVSFQDVTTYSQAGDKAQASVFNGIGTEVNTLEGRKINGHALSTDFNLTAADTGSIPTSASCNRAWNWSGQAGQPPWLWGGSDGTNMYVYNPSNFNVNYANSAGDTASINSALTVSASEPSGTLAPGKLWGVY